MILRRSGDGEELEETGGGGESPEESSLLDLPLGHAKGDMRPKEATATHPAGAETVLIEPEWKPRPEAPRSTADRKPRPPKKERTPRPPKKAAAGGRRSWPAVVLALVAGAAGGFFLNRHPAVAVLSEGLLDFGEVRLQEPSPGQEVELSNAGQRALPVTAVQIEGEGAEQFAVTADGCTGTEVTSEAGCTLEVRFTPATTGTQRAWLVVEGVAANAVRLPLLGQGIAPLLEVEPAKLNFGRLTVGTRSRRETLRFANRGSAALQVSSVELKGRGSGDFVVHSDGCSGKTLGPNERCSLSCSFNPTAAGARSATLRLAGAQGALGPDVELNGRGLPQEPQLDLDPERIDFAEVRVGTVSEVRKVTLKNDGTGPLTIRRLLLRADGGEEEGAENEETPAAVPFQVETRGCASRTLAPRQSCTVEVRFEPSAEGAERALLEIRHTAGGGVHRLALLGTGTAPHVFLDPLRLDFGEVPLGSESNASFVRLVNSGTGPLTVTEIRTRGTDAGAFTARPVGCTTAPIAAKASCGIEVRFTPKRGGAHEAEIVLAHDATGETDRIPLRGSGTAGRASVDHDSLEFGRIHVGSEASQELVIKNTGRARLGIERVALRGRHSADYSLPADRCSGQRLEPGASCAVTVRFAPSTEGRREAAVTIAHDSGDDLVVPLRAQATPRPVPQIRIGSTSVDFGTVAVGDRGEAVEVKVTNPGTGPLAIRDLQLGGEDSLDFRIVPGTCESTGASPGGSCTVVLRFVPRAEGLRSAVLEITHNAGAPVRLALEGTGAPPPPPSPPGVGGTSRGRRSSR